MPVRPKAPTRTALSRDYILRSALYLIDEQGLSALSLRALGRQMGVSQTAIYRHI
ncbi:TetR family transcriptional regulator, partial [Bifidobacterium aemilianum]